MAQYPEAMKGTIMDARRRFAIEFGGAIVFCDSAAEVREVLGLPPTITVTVGPISVVTANGNSVPAPATRTRPNGDGAFKKALMEIFASGPSGIEAAELARRLGMQGARGLSSLSTNAPKMLGEELGKHFDTVVRRERREDGRRFWMPGDRIKDALERVGQKADPTTYCMSA